CRIDQRRAQARQKSQLRIREPKLTLDRLEQDRQDEIVEIIRRRDQEQHAQKQPTPPGAIQPPGTCLIPHAPLSKLEPLEPITVILSQRLRATDAGGGSFLITQILPVLSLCRTQKDLTTVIPTVRGVM